VSPDTAPVVSEPVKKPSCCTDGDKVKKSHVAVAPSKQVSQDSRIVSKRQTVIYEPVVDSWLLECASIALLQPGDGRVKPSVMQDIKHERDTCISLLPMQLITSAICILLVYLMPLIADKSVSFMHPVTFSMIVWQIGYTCVLVLAIPVGKKIVSPSRFFGPVVGCIPTCILIFVAVESWSFGRTPLGSCVLLSMAAYMSTQIAVACNYYGTACPNLIRVFIPAICSVSWVVVSFHTLLNITVTSDWVGDTLLNGVGYPILVVLIGRIFVGDFFTFVVTAYFDATSVENIIFYSISVKQVFHFNGQLLVMLLDSDRGFWLALLISNIFELLSVVFNLKLQRSGFLTRVGIFLRLVKPHQPGKVENQRPDSRSASGLLGLWIKNTQLAPSAKFAMLCHGEEMAEKVNAAVASVVGFALIYLIKKRQDDVGMLVLRCFSLIFAELFEDLTKKRLVLYLDGVCLSYVPIAKFRTTRIMLSLFFYPVTITPLFLMVWFAVEQENPN